jgi:hypothetical protein
VTSSCQMISRGIVTSTTVLNKGRPHTWNSRYDGPPVIRLQEEAACTLGRGMLHNEMWVFVEVRRRFLDTFDVRAVMISRHAPLLLLRSTDIQRKANDVRNEVCDLVGYYGAVSGNSVSTFRDNLSVPPSRVKKSNFSLDLLTLNDGSDSLSRNVDTELPLYVP